MITCDLCTGQIVAKDLNNNCETCGDTKQFCKACLKKLSTKDGTEKFCPSHWEVAKTALNSTKLLTRYVRLFWKELGVEPAYVDDSYTNERTYFSADFYGLDLSIRYTPNLDESGNLVSINHMVLGLVNAEKIYTIPIHNHDEAKGQVKKAILTALKNKRVAFKSAKSRKLNEVNSIVAEYDQKLADIDTIVKKWTHDSL